MIKIENLHYEVTQHGEAPVTILKDINLTVTDGESVCLMGPNGSGKTTLARCLNGLLLPQSGQIVIDNMPVQNDENLAEIRRRVGIVFQNPENQIVSSTVERELAFGLENISMPHAEMNRVVTENLERFDLARYRFQSPHLLSGGEKQRLAIASVMAMQPRYLIFDEPTSLLDPVSRRKVLLLIKKLHAAANGNQSPLTTIIITQLADEALQADRLIIMAAGEIILDGPPREIMQQVDRLRDIGIGVPVEFELAHRLIAAGYPQADIFAQLQLDN